MKEMTVRAYSESVNYVILQTPGRNYPGCVVQGDQLRSLLRTTQRALSFLLTEEYEQAAEEMKDLEGELLARCSHYERVLRDHGLELPYIEPVLTTEGESDRRVQPD